MHPTSGCNSDSPSSWWNRRRPATAHRGRGFAGFIIIDDKGNDFFKEFNLG
jgi:hypothetical protein